MDDWKQLLASPELPVRDVLARLDTQQDKVVFIVAADQALLGSVTDGDIRRGLLRGMGLSDPVSTVMNPHPLQCQPDEAASVTLRELMKRRKVALVPIVADGRMYGLVRGDSVASRLRRDNPVFLMAGGFGTRLRPLTDHCPKPMLRVGDKPILQIILESLIEAGLHRFYFSTHYLPEVIREHFGDGSAWGVTIEYVHEASPLGTGGALGLLPDSVGDLPLILMNGDLLTRLDFGQLLAFHDEHGGEATICVREFEMQVPYGVLELEARKLRSIVEKPIHRFNVNAGIYVIGPQLRRQVHAGEKIDMTTLLEQRLAAGGHISAFPLHEYWLDIGMLKDFERAQRDILRWQEQA